MSSTQTQRARAGRPMLRHSSQTGGSFIQDHQQYRPWQAQNGIDAALESGESAQLSHDVGVLALKSQVQHRQSPSQGSSPSRIKDSGIVHTMSHRNCQPTGEDASKLVATLFYKSNDLRHPHIHPDSTPSPDPKHMVPQPMLSAGAAPTVDMKNYPLEPPPPEPEPLDHLYGPYVSQICLTHFLQILDGLQNPWQRISSSHRCLDSQPNPRVMEITFSPPPNPDYISFDELRRHESLWRFEREWNVEVVLQKDDIWRRHKRLAVFDMDSTLIQQEVIDEIAKVLGVEKEVSAITSEAMNGRLDFSASLRARVALLKGVRADVFERLKSVITVTRGARELCVALKRLGFKLAVLSGGFTPLAEWLAADLGLDYAFANHLVVSEDGRTLTGDLNGPIVNAERKATLLQEIAAKEGIPLEQVLAVGDGANDLLMMKTAGLGVAFNAKPIVQLEAPSRINTESLQDILYILGFTKDEQAALLG
ncbi:MAG: hypothetical protein M1833_006034 [Piccolia ochrophora]|nr:MAG: hypothetical protein M1833_006034 [Piccolia ochrophora]